MRYIVDTLARYINNVILEDLKDITTEIVNPNVQLPLLEMIDENLYKFCDEYKDRVYSNYSPADNKSYIELVQIGREKKKYRTVDINIALRITKFNIDNVPYRDFEYMCTGILDKLIETHGKTIEDFIIVNTISLNNTSPIRTAENIYYCEMLLDFILDVVSIPNEDLILRTI